MTVEEAVELKADTARVLIGCDATGTITSVTGPLPDLLGYRPGEVLGRPVTDFVDPRNRDLLSTMVAALVGQAHAEFWDEVRLRHADGRYHWVDALATGIAGEDGGEPGLLVSLRRLLPEESRVAEIRHAELRVRTLLERTADVIVLSSEGEVTYVSPAVSSVLGWSPAAFAADHATLVHPDDAGFDLLAPGDGRLVRLRRGDGTYRWVEVTSVDLHHDPRVQGGLTLLRDATGRVEAEQARERAEARLQKLVRHSSDVIVLLDGELKVSWVSPAVHDVLGLAPDDLLGRPVDELVHPDEQADARRYLARVLQGEPLRRVTVARVRNGAGAWRWLGITAVDRRDDPDIAAVLCNVSDLTERVSAEVALRDSEERFRRLADGSPIGVFQHDLGGRCAYVNAEWERITGLTAAESVGSGWLRALHPDDVDRMVAAHARLADSGYRVEVRLRIVRTDGALRWVDVSTGPLHDGSGATTGVVGTVVDVTDAVRALSESARMSHLLEATTDLVAIVEPDGRELYLNDAARRFWGVGASADAAEVLERMPSWMTERWDREIWPDLERHGLWQGEIEATVDGRPVPLSTVFIAHRDAEGRVEVISTISRDISERRAFEARLEHQATHDPLTGLPNRTLLLDRLEVALGRAQRQGSRLALLFLDIDRFKVVNDSMGHGLGDRVLASLAVRLSDAVRAGDTVARFGGDEFVMLCEDLEHEGEAQEVARRVAELVSRPVLVGDVEVVVSVSIGIAHAVGGAYSPEELLRDADAAMYQAKARGRAQHAVFDSQMRTQAVDRLDLETDLRRALAEGEFRLLYQPIVRLGSGRIVGAEALLRWAHPTRGLLRPEHFLAVADETRLLVPIGEWVLSEACAAARRLGGGGVALSVNVNLGRAQLASPGLLDAVGTALASSALDPGLLDLEVTEDVLMDDLGRTEAALHGLKRLGARIAVDDFGTGYSSMNHLRRLPVDVLKLDRSFVAGLGRVHEDEAIATAVTHLAHSLGLEVVAEGVETSGQLAGVRHLGCEMVQGYYVAQPLAEDRLADLLATRPTW